MPNIVYVLTNPAMPGIVKIGMTDRLEVQPRMRDLYTTGVPLPFDCVIAREIEDKEAAEIERALHTAFDPRLDGAKTSTSPGRKVTSRKRYCTPYIWGRLHLYGASRRLPDAEVPDSGRFIGACAS